MSVEYKNLDEEELFRQYRKLNGLPSDAEVPEDFQNCVLNFKRKMDRGGLLDRPALVYLAAFMLQEFFAELDRRYGPALRRLEELDSADTDEASVNIDQKIGGKSALGTLTYREAASNPETRGLLEERANHHTWRGKRRLHAQEALRVVVLDTVEA